MSQDPKHLECPVCLDIFDEPCALPCGHSVCRDKCLLPWLQDHRNSTCPSCKQELSDPKAEFPINYQLREAVEAHHQANLSVTEICSACDSTPATLFCKDCDANLCRECRTNLHVAKFMASHFIVPIVERQTVQIKKCPSHPSKELEYFCSECSVAICMNCCVFDDHFEHKSALQPIADAEQKMESVITEINTQLESTQKEVSQSVQSLAVSISDIPQELLKEVSALLNETHLDLELFRNKFYSCEEVVVSTSLSPSADQVVQKKVGQLLERIKCIRNELTGFLKHCTGKLSKTNFGNLKHLESSKSTCIRKQNKEEVPSNGNLMQVSPERVLEEPEQHSHQRNLDVSEENSIEARALCAFKFRFCHHQRHKFLVVSHDGLTIFRGGTSQQPTLSNVLGDQPLQNGNIYKWKVATDGRNPGRRCVGIIPRKQFRRGNSLNGCSNAYIFLSDLGVFSSISGPFRVWPANSTIEITVDLIDFTMTITDSSNSIDLATNIHRLEDDCYYPVFCLPKNSQFMLVN
ncbi:hypothetical protein P9112_004355 [Eukaryota sp. TZLM1-RC]